MATCIVLMIVFTGSYLTLGTFMGMSAYASDDPKHCYYIFGLD